MTDVNLGAVASRDDLFGQPVGRAVSARLGRPWTAVEFRDMADLACHPAAVLSDGRYPVFAKFSAADDGRRQFEVELAGLRELADRAGVQVPAPLGVVDAPGGCLLILEAVRTVEREARHWREIGRTLARIHKVKGDRFGHAENGYFGPLPQDNAPADDWPSFYGERRVMAGMRMAMDAGYLPGEFIPRLEKLLRRLPELCGPAVPPTLIHGDAQQNNFISTDSGPYVIDPAVYYGHPEMDLAYIDYFQPVPEDVFDGYREIQPIDPGFPDRRALWRIWGYLAAVTVEGAGYLKLLDGALRAYE